MIGINTILFDLDGTLLPMDMNMFLKSYLYEIGRAFADLSDPKTFVFRLLEATQFMLSNDGSKTNSEVFKDKFSKMIDRHIDDYLERFEDFYDKGYLNLKSNVTPNQNIKQAVEILKDKGYEMAIATNPIFPMKAVVHRIRWADLEPKDFLYVSSYEKNRFCKPNSGFFFEVLDAIGKEAYHCLMVGNDVQEDLAAESAGIRTYLITDHVINRQNGNFNSTYKGNYEEFLDFVVKLPVVV